MGVARHHNELSWYVRPLFLLPFCYFAYRRSVWGIVVTLLVFPTSLFWFPTPENPSPRVEGYLAWERQFLLEGSVVARVALVLLVVTFFVALVTAFWKRSWLWGLAVVNAGTLLKVIWSVAFGGAAGWTGFMQHTLQERRGPLVASILVAPAFVLQHLPILLMDAGVGLASLIIVGALVMVAVFFRVVVMWLYNGSGRSVLVVALFHSAYNSVWGTGEHKFTGELISGPAATLIPIGVVAVVAVVVAAFTKGRLSYEPERVPQRAATARS